MTSVRTLEGRTILLTRPAQPDDPLAKGLRQRGASVIEAPTVKLVPGRSASLTAAIADLEKGRFDWLVLTSQTTVRVLADRIEAVHARRPRVAVVGEGTAAAFRRWAGRRADLQPGAFTTSALGRAFPRGTGRVLCARADVADSDLEEALAAKGWDPVRVDAYKTLEARTLPPDARRSLRDGAVDAITFTSASTVRGFVRSFSGARGSPKVVCIGPVTSKQARSLGLHVHAVADPHTIQGLIAACERALASRRASIHR